MSWLTSYAIADNSSQGFQAEMRNSKDEGKQRWPSTMWEPYTQPLNLEVCLLPLRNNICQI